MKESLLSTFLSIVAPWRGTFPQQRTYLRAVRQALGGLVCLGLRCLSRIIWTNGGQMLSWSAEYFLHSRCRWDPQALFRPVLEKALPFCSGRLIGVAIDDTRLSKTGAKIKQAFYQRDPLSPPFHVNLMRGLRFLQASLLVPLHRKSPQYTRALPVRFEEVSRVKKPGRKASPSDWAEYKIAAKAHNLSTRFVAMAKSLRETFDAIGAQAKTIVLAADGSFCNRTCMRATVDRVELLARARKDARLCLRSTDGSRRFYDPHSFTPESVLQDDTRPWQVAKVCYGFKSRKVRYKEVSEVYWQRGSGRRQIGLLVIAPTPYRKRKSNKFYYRQPAYLLTTDLHSPASALLRIYFGRWQIEVNHREEKDTLGIGQAQLWNPISVPKQPVLCVAAYSALLLASLIAFGPGRTNAFAPLPKWRRHAHRPSCLDLVTLLRDQIQQHPQLLEPFAMPVNDHALVTAAAA